MTSGLLTEIDHVAIAVRDLEAAIAYYAEAFAMWSISVSSISSPRARRGRAAGTG